MQIDIKGVHMEITPALRDSTIKKFEKFNRFAEFIKNINVTLKVDKLIQIAEAKMKLRHDEIHAHAQDKDMYIAVDQLVDKLSKQLTKHKEILQKHRGDDIIHE